MKFNRAKHVERMIKKALLEETISQLALIKEANLEKDAMATYRDQKDLGDLINRRFDHVVPSGRIQAIADEILKQFKPFLRNRLSPAQGGDNKLYMKVPVINDAGKRDPVLQIPVKNQSVEEMIRDLNLPLPNQQQDLKDMVPSGCMYYRYSYSRTILPDEKTGKREREIALDNLTMLREALHGLGVEFNPEQFIQDAEKLGIALMPGFNTDEVSGASAENFVRKEAPLAAERIRAGQPKPGDHALIQLLNYADKHSQRDPNQKMQRGQPAGAFGIGRRKQLFLYDCSPATGQRVFSPHVSMIRSESTLARMIEAKIACGYRLNKDGLVNTIYRYIYATAKNQEKAAVRVNGQLRSKKVTTHTLKVLARQWQQQIKYMLAVYAAIEASVKNQEFKFAASEDISSAYGLDWSGGKKYRRLVPPQIGGEAASWNYIHFQMLLQNITLSEPRLRRVPSHIKVGKYSFYDPSKSLKFYSDGISQRTGVQSQAGKRSVILPPFVAGKKMRAGEELMPDETGRGVAQLETDQINLGLRHLKYNGDAVAQLLRVYGKTAMNVLSAIKSPNFQQLFPAGNEFNPAHVVLREYPNAYMGSESLARMIDEIAQSEDVQGELARRLDAVRISSGTDQAPRVFNPQAFPALQKYGYAIAKVMEIIHGLIHAADESNFTYMDKTTGKTNNFTMFGQSYSTSSGVGRGGELLLSVRYAYKAELSEYAGNNEQAEKIIKDEYRRRGHEVRIPAEMSPASETQFPQRGDVDPGMTTQEGVQLSQPKPGCTFVSNFEFFLGQSSRDPNATGGYSSFNTVLADTDWNKCVAKLRQLYSNKEINVDEISEDFIWDINADLDHLESSIHAALTAARDQIANISLTIVNRNHDSEHIEPTEIPVDSLTDQTSQQVAEEAEAKTPDTPVENVPTDETQSDATPEQQPVPEAARTIPVAFPELRQVLSRDPSEVQVDEILRALPKRIDTNLESMITHFLDQKYGQGALDDIYEELMDKYTDPTVIVRKLLQQLKAQEIADEQDRMMMQSTRTSLPYTPPPGMDLIPRAQWEANKAQYGLNVMFSDKDDPREGTSQVPAGFVGVLQSQPTFNPGTREDAYTTKIHKEPAKSMFKRVDPTGKLLHSSIQERLVNLANTFDSKGLKVLANKLDMLLTNLIRMG